MRKCLTWVADYITKKLDTHSMTFWFGAQVVALVCNFSASHNSSTARLNHWELETLFHEFGHALHSLLSRTVF